MDDHIILPLSTPIPTGASSCIEIAASYLSHLLICLFCENPPFDQLLLINTMSSYNTPSHHEVVSNISRLASINCDIGLSILWIATS